MDVCQECLDTSQSFDSDGIPFVIDNSATCIICNDRSQFVGPLRVQHTSVETTHGTASLVYAGTIAIHLMTNAGQTFESHVPNAIYDPNLPLNILGIPFLGDFLAPRILIQIEMTMGCTFGRQHPRQPSCGIMVSIRETSLIMLDLCLF